jgi:hypothetical protein
VKGARQRHGARVLAAGILCAAAAAFRVGVAEASPWAEVGDAQLRSDIQLLAAAGAVNDITTQWPLPWAGLLESLDRPDALKGQPANVRAAARRVLDAAQAALRVGELHSSAEVDLTNQPSLVRGYDGMGRERAQVTIYNEIMMNSTAIRLAVGGELSDWGHGKGDFKPDGSYIAQTLGGAVFYAGYLSHWWGPGWISALGLSNNARPFPQIGLQRLSTSRSTIPVVSWLGPWQAEFLVGVLDGPRIDSNTLYSGLRISISPFHGLELSAARTEEFCGEHHPCKPIAYYFNLTNEGGHANHVNDEGELSIHYIGMLGRTAYEAYMQLMNEDSNPIAHSGTSHLFGASMWIPVWDRTARITAEYADSVATYNIFSFGRYMYQTAYTNTDYVDGMRYRGRTLGFSLDTDSRLASLQASWDNDRNWTYTLTYDHAQIGTPHTGTANIITPTPVTVNLGEARLRLPFSWGSVDLAARVQDDQPRPDHGYLFSFESGLRIDL